MKIKDENYYIIQGWMLNKLDLKGVALNVFAIIYGFTQDNESEFSGSRQYLADFIGVSRPTIDKALEELISKGLILKISHQINGVTFNRYKIGELDFTGCKETLQGYQETLQGGCKESLHNNIEENNEENNEDINDSLDDSNEIEPDLFGLYPEPIDENNPDPNVKTDDDIIDWYKKQGIDVIIENGAIKRVNNKQ